VALDEVSIRDLRNRGGDVVDQVERGMSVLVTRAGRPVAELRPLRRAPLSVAALIERRASLPPLDPDSLRADLDAVIDSSL
jgi:prevent-host-death family protein